MTVRCRWAHWLVRHWGSAEEQREDVVITGHNKFSPLLRHVGRMMNCCRRKAVIIPLIHSTTTDCSSKGAGDCPNVSSRLTTTLPQAVTEHEQ